MLRGGKGGKLADWSFRDEMTGILSANGTGRESKRTYTIVHDDIRWCTEMRFYFRKDAWHDSWVREVGFDVEVAVTHRPISNTSSRSGDLVPSASELVRNESPGPRTNAEDEDDGLGWHVCGIMRIVERGDNLSKDLWKGQNE